MKESRSLAVIYCLGGLLAIFVSFVSLFGVLTPNYYRSEKLSWQIQSLGQDLFDLCLMVPVLLISTFRFRRSYAARSFWSGSTVFLLYTFIIYCFDLHFTQLFIAYCLILGFSFYGSLYFAFTQIFLKDLIQPAPRLRKFTGIYFITTGILFYFLWLRELIPATVSNQMPASWQDAGLVSNPVQVIDLAVMLPALILTGILFIKKIKIASVLMSVLLAFCILMDLNIGSLVLFMKLKQQPANASIAIVMGVLAILSLYLFISLWRKGNSTLPFAEDHAGKTKTASNKYSIRTQPIKE